MTERTKTRLRRPSFWLALRLQCPYCGKTPLRRQASWFSFRDGCTVCNYRYEREEGYFGGGSQIINFSVISLSAFGVGALLLWRLPETDPLLIAGIVSVGIVFVGAAFFPFGMALWIYFDHRLHSLTEDDKFLRSAPSGETGASSR